MGLGEGGEGWDGRGLGVVGGGAGFFYLCRTFLAHVPNQHGLCTWFGQVRRVLARCVGGRGMEMLLSCVKVDDETDRSV